MSKLPPARNHLDRVVGAKPCPAIPKVGGLGRLGYPWEHMQPGHFFLVDDPSDEARARLAAAASAYGRRAGMKFATGPANVFNESDELEHVGWWCVRHDGCEVLPPEPTLKQKVARKRRQEIYDARMAKAIARTRPPRAEPASALGDHAPDVAPVIPEAPIEEADAWLRPVVAGEVF